MARMRVVDEIGLDFFKVIFFGGGGVEGFYSLLARYKYIAV